MLLLPVFNLLRRFFYELLPILTSGGISLVNGEKKFKAGVRSVLLCGIETWPTPADLSRIKTSDHAII